LSVEGRTHRIEIGPDFRFEGAPVGREVPRHCPVYRTETDRIANVKTEFAGQSIANHNLSCAWPEDATSRYRSAIAERRSHRVHAAQRQGSLDPVRSLFDIDRHDNLSGRDQLASRVAGDAHVTGHRIEGANDGRRNVRARLLIGAPAEDDSDQGGASAGKCGLEASCHGEKGGEDADDKCDRQDHGERNRETPRKAQNVCSYHHERLLEMGGH
jgi:hypothetical protein